MTKRNDLKAAWRALRAQRDKIRMSKVRSAQRDACTSKNHLGVMNSKNNFHLY